MPLEQGNFDTKTADVSEDEIASQEVHFPPSLGEKSLAGEKAKIYHNQKEDSESIKKLFFMKDGEEIYNDPFLDPVFAQMATVVTEDGRTYDKHRADRAVMEFMEKYPRKAKFYSFNSKSGKVGKRLELEFTREKLREPIPGGKIEYAKTTMPMGYVPPTEKPKTFWGKAKSFFGKIFG